MEDNVVIGVGGDIVPTRSNLQFFESGNVLELLGEDLYKELRKCNYLLFNLEAPLTNVSQPIEKCGPNLAIPQSAIDGLKKMNPYFYTLANNHIKDQGDQGILDTINIFEQNQIAYAGVGRNKNDVKKYHVFEIKGIKIGVYCCCEHEFSCVKDDEAGANPYDPLYSFDDVEHLSSFVDFMIVLYHGGKENYRYPTPNMQKVFRKFSEKGANVVIGQHSHCIGCAEKYNNNLLIYGQGNFIFDASEREEWQTSLLVKLELKVNQNKVCDFSINYIPIIKSHNIIRMATQSEKIKILSDFEKRSNELNDEKKIKFHFRKLCDSNMTNYLKCLKGNRSIVQKVYCKIFNPGFNYYYNNQNRVACENYLICETHLEMLQEIISRGAGNDK